MARLFHALKLGQGMKWSSTPALVCGALRLHGYALLDAMTSGQ